MRSFMKRLTVILHHPWVQVLVGLAVVASALAELSDGMPGKEDSEGVKSEHGVLLFGVVHALKALATMYEGVEQIAEAEAEGRPAQRPQPSGRPGAKD
jgi:hypothetical protein